jgi:glycerol-3-phosphate acyltransferase PlsY
MIKGRYSGLRRLGDPHFTPFHMVITTNGEDLTPLYYWLAGLGAAIGHCWPIYVHFKGGKAVACFMGSAL